HARRTGCDGALRCPARSRQLSEASAAFDAQRLFQSQTPENRVGAPAIETNHRQVPGRRSLCSGNLIGCWRTHLVGTVIWSAPANPPSLIWTTPPQPLSRPPLRPPLHLSTIPSLHHLTAGLPGTTFWKPTPKADSCRRRGGRIFGS